ncbi:spore cortex biosynthesis protein YabQ [Bacillus sp. HMF5848]|uniref:spore cortex biosynthesis protein YabQ n=1 Tax=Bacillus sp. HMF5848 TaxID=2495421 RepID=UPI000F782847|nr:spore cortex biosynthesis protein YabQ [Bacillus sp. HMF5848]RSK25495.1 spore cortex biosynthesis protein YabQ [Bacillus sp. HMF5848]
MSLTTQFFTMIAMVGMGGWFGAALDTYSRFLKRPTRAKWIVFINDILFWFAQGLIIFYVLLLVNEGELRLYIFIALLCGYAAYQSLLKKIYNNFLELLIETIIRIYLFVKRIIQIFVVYPVQWIWRLIVSICVGLVGLCIAFLKVLLKISRFLFTILVAPFLWTGRLLWRLVPNSIRIKVLSFFSNKAGFLKVAKNLAKVWKKWIEKFKK